MNLVHRRGAANPERAECDPQEPEQEHDSDNSGDDRTDVGGEVVRHRRQGTRQSGVGRECDRGKNVRNPRDALLHFSHLLPSVDDESLGGRMPNE